MEPTDRVRVVSLEGDSRTDREDMLAVEEPLEIRVRPGPDRKPASFVVTMRTPGQDDELAAGLLFAEGVLQSRTDLVSLDRPADPRISPEVRSNVLLATVSPEAFERAARLKRGTVMGSACGVCGKTSIDNVLPVDSPPLASSLRLSASFLYALPARLREHQSIFSKTGGLHAAALFRAVDGRLAGVCEDIGRHNATDKLVGRSLLAGELPLEDSVLMVSGRAGFEIVQKAYNAGVPIVAAVSAPSSLAVELADAGGITLVGFLRDRRFNVYTHARRVESARETMP
ncbi:MAG TPA: formate dehydrogenase accessory sulfurtransferase FdhD [Thermoanaerobaculia bacterium]|nr:formate dehydrogenase accessory sulfurtransferase FdhD [Thermoanaerobaculia bacterium]